MEEAKGTQREGAWRGVEREGRLEMLPSLGPLGQSQQESDARYTALLQDTDTHSDRCLIGHTGAIMNDRLPQKSLSH